MQPASTTFGHAGAPFVAIAHAARLHEEEDVACCSALSCYACAFASDTTGLLLAQWLEPDDRHCDVRVFAKYIVSWPCRLCAWACFGRKAARTHSDSNFI